MTGYGEAGLDTPAGRLRAEIRSVNHRYFSTNLRLARAVEKYEPQIREWLRALLPRGHVNVTVSLEKNGQVTATGLELQVDEARARQYAEGLRKLKNALALPGDVDLAMLTRFGDLLVWGEAEPVEVPAEAVQNVLEEAARATVAMRKEEGRRLAADLEERLRAIEKSLAEILELAPARLVAERDRMRRVVAELLDGAAIDDDRVAREIAMIAERWDISEEVVRLRSHLELFRESMDGKSKESARRRATQPSSIA